MADQRFFTRSKPFTLAKLVEIGQCQLHTPVPSEVSEGTEFVGVAPLEQANKDQITVLHNKKYLKDLLISKAGVVILHPSNVSHATQNITILLSESPYRAFALIAAAFYPDAFSVAMNSYDQPIHPSAKLGANCQIEPGVVIGANAEIGNNVYIAANSVIGKSVTIGEGTAIGANVTISHSLIGRNVVIYPGAKIGQAGFGFYMDESGHIQVPQLGRVIVEDGVEIGSNTTIDRGSLQDTIIGAGARIDNLVQIAHNVQIGKGCVIVAQVGISGSTKVGDYCAIAGQAGLTGHLNIGARAKIAAQSGVMRDIKDGVVVGGSPAVAASQWHRQTVALAKIAKRGN